MCRQMVSVHAAFFVSDYALMLARAVTGELGRFRESVLYIIDRCNWLSCEAGAVSCGTFPFGAVMCNAE